MKSITGNSIDTSELICTFMAMQYRRMPIEIESPEETGYHHIGYNLAESSVTEMNLEQLDLNLKNLKFEYTTHKGHEGLRNLIALEGPGLTCNDVLLTGGAAMALFIIHTSLLKSGDHLLVQHPNYSSNKAVPKAIGCVITDIALEFDSNWQLDLKGLESRITPKTKLISLTYPHNPTGQMLSQPMIDQLIALANNHDLKILFDETYRDACFITDYPLLASLHHRFISVISFSKGYGLPGIRMGAIITQDAILQERFLAAKEMIQICNPPLEEAIAFYFYHRKEMFLKKINDRAQANLTILIRWLTAEIRLEAIYPRGGVVCFARFKENNFDFKLFHQILNNDFGTFTGPGHWFDMPDRYMRIGFGYPTANDLTCGLQNITACLDFLESGKG